MFRSLLDAPLALGFLSWRFTPGQDALVLVVKGTYRLTHGGRAIPLEEQDPLNGDVLAGDDPLTAACRYASDVVPFKPRADAMLVGKVRTPEGRAIPQCSASFAVGGASLSLLVSGDRYWLDPTAGIASEPRPFTEMDLGYERAFGGPGFPANPAGKGIFAATAREAIARPLPNVEHPRELVRRPSDRPAPAGFGPLSPFWAHRASKWPKLPPEWVAERWPYAPDRLDYGYFNAAQPALQIEGYLRGDESVVCENLHPRHRRFECELPRVRPRAFALDRVRDEERFREVGLRLDTLWIDMEEEKLVLVWRGSTPVASEDFEEVSHVFVTAESLDDPRAPLDHHKKRFEMARMKATAAEAPAAPARNDNDAPPPEIAKPEVPRLDISKPEVPKPKAAPLPGALRDKVAKMGLPEAAIAAFERGDVDAGMEITRVAIGLPQDAFDKLFAQQRELFQKMLGGEPPPKPPRIPKPKDDAPPAANAAWSRARVIAHLAAGGSLAGEDLSGVDLSELDLRARDLTGTLLAKASLARARLDDANLTGANLAGATGERCSLRGATLDEADLTGASLPEAVLAGAELRGALLDDAILTGAKLEGVKAEGAYLRRADLRRADLSRAALREAHLDGARLDGATLRGADLTEASAEGMSGEAADLREAILVKLNASESSRLSGAKLAGCKADRSRWAGADLKDADLARASLRNADLSRADLRGARLAGADCFEVDFTRAKLERASLEGASLWAARMEEADLRRAILARASLYQAHLWKARLEGADLEGALTAGTLLESPVRGWAR